MTAFEPGASGVTARPTSRSRVRRLAAALRDQKLLGAGLFVLLIFIIMAAAPDLIATHRPSATDASAAGHPPSAQHWLGTDLLGRDVYSRIIHGTRTSLTVSFASVVFALTVGSSFGLVAGYVGGVIDQIMGRFMDVLFSLPPLLLAIAIAGILGPSVRNAVLAIAIVYVPHFFRIARGGALGQTGQPYITSARIIGSPNRRILGRHILPNTASQIVVQFTVTLAYAVLLEASLSFLGLGVQPPTPSWGSILNEGRPYLQTVPWLSIFPGLMILAAVMSVNLVGDGLRDLWDPKGK